MSKEYLKKQIEEKRKKIIDLRSKISKAKDEKKRKMQYLSNMIKISTNKEFFRKQKVTEAGNYDRKIESLKKEIESSQKDIERLKKSLQSYK